MARVLGIGGVFLRSSSPTATREWYQRVLGLQLEPWGGVQFDPLPVGYTVWCPFNPESSYFSPSTMGIMINFVVDDLDGVLERAAAHGVKPVDVSEGDPNGRFAWLMDHDGMKIELWQPKAAEAEPASTPVSTPPV